MFPYWVRGDALGWFTREEAVHFSLNVFFRKASSLLTSACSHCLHGCHADPCDIMREGNDVERQRRGWQFFHPFVSFLESSKIWCEKVITTIFTQRNTEGSASRGQHLTCSSVPSRVPCEEAPFLLPTSLPPPDMRASTSCWYLVNMLSFLG